MKIEDIKLLLNDLDRQEKILSWEFNDLYTFVNKQQSKINQLEADKLELSKAIEENYMYECRGEDYCIHCESKNWEHAETCIVNKAQKYIKEVEK